MDPLSSFLSLPTVLDFLTPTACGTFSFSDPALLSSPEFNAKSIIPRGSSARRLAGVFFWVGLVPCKVDALVFFNKGVCKLARKF